MSRNSASVTPHSAGPRIGRSSSRFFSMRPSHLVIEGGQPPLLKITVWLGNKAADKYRLAPLFGRADVGKIPHGHRWDLPRSEFAPDSPLERSGFELLVPVRGERPAHSTAPVSIWAFLFSSCSASHSTEPRAYMVLGGSGLTVGFAQGAVLMHTVECHAP